MISSSSEDSSPPSFSLSLPPMLMSRPVIKHACIEYMNVCMYDVCKLNTYLCCWPIAWRRVVTLNVC